MKNQLERAKKNLRSKKGFSLVELIIVIAIMAALVAILAPQYTKYVEKSRVSADQTQFDELIKAVKVAAADPDRTSTLGDVTVTYDGSDHKCTIASSGFSGDVAKILGATSFEVKSSAGRTACNDATSIKVTVDTSTYEVAISGVTPTSWTA